MSHKLFAINLEKLGPTVRLIAEAPSCTRKGDQDVSYEINLDSPAAVLTRRHQRDDSRDSVTFYNLKGGEKKISQPGEILYTVEDGPQSVITTEQYLRALILKLPLKKFKDTEWAEMPANKRGKRSCGV